MSSMKLYIGNLSFKTTEADLTKLFSTFGQVVSAVIIKDRYSGQSRGFAFVEMSSRGEGEKAVAGLNGQEVAGQQIKVSEAKPRADRSDRGRGGPRGGRR
ncbi:MAG: RNA-binding protein [Thermodesulfobacteriota bacterium]